MPGPLKATDAAIKAYHAALHLLGVLGVCSPKGWEPSAQGQGAARRPGLGDHGAEIGWM